MHPPHLKIPHMLSSRPNLRAGAALALVAATILVQPRPVAGQFISQSIDGLLSPHESRGFRLIAGTNIWGVSIGWLTQGERKEVLFDAIAGRTYIVAAGGDGSATDLDLCLYNPAGSTVSCDTLANNRPVVEFTATLSGTYHAELTAYTVAGTGTFSAIAVFIY